MNVGPCRITLEVLKKGITTSQIKKAFANCRKLAIMTAASLLWGTGLETPEDYRLTEQLLQEIRPTTVWKNKFTGIPSSPLYEALLTEDQEVTIDDIGLLHRG